MVDTGEEHAGYENSMMTMVDTGEEHAGYENSMMSNNNWIGPFFCCLCAIEALFRARHAQQEAYVPLLIFLNRN
jgi:hypothetical protein